jgi:hypothetical protein
MSRSFCFWQSMLFLSITHQCLVANCISPKSFPKEQRKSLGKVARTFELEDDGTDGAWPKGKVLHKLFFTKKNLRKGTILSRKENWFSINELGSKLYVPPNQVQPVIKHFHQKGANKHHGWTRTFDLIKEKHAGVTEQMVREFTNKCEVCISFTTVQYAFTLLYY